MRTQPSLERRIPATDWKTLAVVFGTVLPAEQGDKTQFATVLLATDKEVNQWLAFVGAFLALIATSALGVLGAGLIAQYVSERTLRAVAGTGFSAIAVGTLIRCPVDSFKPGIGKARRYARFFGQSL